MRSLGRRRRQTLNILVNESIYLTKNTAVINHQILFIILYYIIVGLNKCALWLTRENLIYFRTAWCCRNENRPTADYRTCFGTLAKEVAKDNSLGLNKQTPLSSIAWLCLCVCAVLCVYVILWCVYGASYGILCTI